MTKCDLLAFKSIDEPLFAPQLATSAILSIVTRRRELVGGTNDDDGSGNHPFMAPRARIAGRDADAVRRAKSASAATIVTTKDGD